MYPTKRRRLNDASALNKPFRSPLKSPVVPEKHKRCSEKQDEPTQESTTSTQQTWFESPQDIQAATRPTQTQPALTHSTLPRVTSVGGSHNVHAQPSAHRSLSSITRQKDRSPEYIALQKRHSALVLQIKDLEAALDTSARALELLRHPEQDAELHASIDRWRSIAQDAAEELFVHARDRVDSLGGVSAMRSNVARQRFDQDEVSQNQSEGSGIVREDALRQADRCQDHDRAEAKLDSRPDPEAPDDNFTIRVMLEQMSVNLELIGYDKLNEGWTEQPIKD